jgi:hypothetical protein
MSLPALASLNDLLPLVGSVTDDGRARALLAYASALIRTEAGEDWVDTDGNLDGVPDIIKMICCKVVERSLSNPMGLTAEAVVNYRAEYGNSSSDLYLTKQERRLVRKAAGSVLIGSVELQTPYRKYDAADVYMTVDNGGEELPMGPWPEPSDG